MIFQCSLDGLGCHASPISLPAFGVSQSAQASLNRRGELHQDKHSSAGFVLD